MAAGASGVKAGKAFVVIEAVDKTAFIFKRVSMKLKQLGTKVRQMGQSMVTRGLAALTPAALSVRTFANFDDAMRKVEARSSGTAQQMAALRDQAKELGRTTSFTATQVANLQAKIAQKGFDRSAIQNMTADVLNLARAAGEGDEGDTILAADLVAGTLRAFGKDASQAANVADVFTAAVNNSNFDLNGLVTSMATAGPVANRFNLSLEDTVATLAGMTNLNIDPSTAASSFKNMMLKLSDEAKRSDFNQRIQELTGKSIKFTDDNGNLRNLPTLLFEISDALDGLGTADQGQILNELFGLRAVVGAGAVGSAKDSFLELKNTLDNVSGTAATTAEAMDAGLGGSFRKFMSAVEGVAIAIGEALEPALTALTTFITDNMGAWTQWIENNQGVVLAIVGAVAGVVLLGVAMIALGFILSAIGTAFGVASTALVIFKGLLAILLSPVGLVIAAVAAVIAILYKFSSAFREIANGVVGFVTDKFAAMAETLVKTFGGVMDALSMGDFEAAWNILVEGLTLTWMQFVNTLKTAWDSFVTFWVQAWQGAIGVVKTGMLQAQKAIATTILDLASKDGILGNLLDKILGVDVSEERTKALKLERQRIDNLIRRQTVDAPAYQAKLQEQSGQREALLAGLGEGVDKDALKQRLIDNAMNDFRSRKFGFDPLTGESRGAAATDEEVMEGFEGLGVGVEDLRRLRDLTASMKHLGLSIKAIEGTDTTFQDGFTQARDDMRNQFDSDIERVQTQVGETLAARDAAVASRNAEREAAVAESRARLDKLLADIEARKNAEAEGPDDLAAGLNEAKEGLAEVLGGLEGPRSVIAPEINTGLERGTVAAAQQFHKNRQENLAAKAVAIAEEQRNLLQNIDEALRNNDAAMNLNVV